MFCNCQREFRGKIVWEPKRFKKLPIVASFHLARLAIWIRITTTWGKCALNDENSAQTKNMNSIALSEKAEKVAINVMMSVNKSRVQFPFFGNTNVDLILTTWENTVASFSQRKEAACNSAVARGKLTVTSWHLKTPKQHYHTVYGTIAAQIPAAQMEFMKKVVHLLSLFKPYLK